MSDQPGVSTKQRRTSAEVKQIVAGFASSGLRKVEFWRREQISSSMLFRHLQQPEETSTAAAKAGLIGRGGDRQQVGEGCDALLNQGPRSNSAIAPMTWNMSLPAGVLKRFVVLAGGIGHCEFG